VALPASDPAAGVRRYRVVMTSRPNDAADPAVWTLDARSRGDRVTDLDPGGTYCFQVFALAVRQPTAATGDGATCMVPTGPGPDTPAEPPAPGPAPPEPSSAPPVDPSLPPSPVPTVSPSVSNGARHVPPPKRRHLS
jgi:hypothetical protein